jgi:hypothetical protein
MAVFQWDGARCISGLDPTGLEVAHHTSKQPEPTGHKYMGPIEVSSQQSCRYADFCLPRYQNRSHNQFQQSPSAGIENFRLKGDKHLIFSARVGAVTISIPVLKSILILISVPIAIWILTAPGCQPLK